MFSPASSLMPSDPGSLPSPSTANISRLIRSWGYLRQPQVPEFRARGMSDTEIVDAMHGIAQAGILKIVQRGGKVGLVPPAAGAAAAGLESPTASRARQQKAKVKRRQRRQFRR